jgi:hypothetical protein
MALFKGNRNALLRYLDKVAPNAESGFWRVVTSLCEILPKGCEDEKMASGLLAGKENLLREAKTISQQPTEQQQLF